MNGKDAAMTNKLQADHQSLSKITPAVVELQWHLQNCQARKAVIKAMLQDMNARFGCIRDPAHEEFNPVPVAACLMDPTVACMLMTADMKPLLEAAKSYVLNQVSLISVSITVCFNFKQSFRLN